jgi:hypothetical protein
MFRRLITAILVTLGLALAAPRAHACRVVEVSFTPSPDLQIVVWLEDAAGTFVDTVFITRMTGTYGIGNRPGMYTFNSELLWPYGRRETVFPVWAHRHGMEYPMLFFQDEDDQDLSHAIGQSSLESYFCRPLRRTEPVWNASADAGTCATPSVYTDKGKFERTWDAGGPITAWSLYPPRNDLNMFQDGVDHPDVEELADWNDLDAVSQATPPGGAEYTLRFGVPGTLPDGDYVVWVEASKEFDPNEFFDYPSPTGIPWSEYGVAYRGQPSVVWRVPFEVGTTESIGLALDYEGYGDPDGIDGDLSPPDPMITAGVEGSGAGRLLVGSGAEGPYRVRVATRPSDDTMPPGAPGQLGPSDVGVNAATMSFVEPSDDGGASEAAVVGYEVRYLVGVPMDETNFAMGQPAGGTIVPVGPGATQTFVLADLTPDTSYWVGVRAHDGCLNMSPIAIASFTTPRAEGGEIDACFVATAAYGSPMMEDVGLLREFRDRALRGSIFGEIFVQSYYSFGPALAELIRPSELLRGFARSALEPLVRVSRSVLR